MQEQKTMYEPLNTGRIGIRPQQINKDERRVEGDDGEETALHITRTDMHMAFTIVHYDKNTKEIMRSALWEIDAKKQGITMPVEIMGDKIWILIGMNGVQLHVVRANNADITFRIVDPVQDESPLEEDIPRIEAGKGGSYYILLERLYEAIGEHEFFLPLSS